MNMITYRCMKPEEATHLCELVNRVFHEFVAPGYSQEGIDTFLEYVQPDKLIERQRNNHFTWVAIQDSNIVGTIHIRDYDHVSLMFVDKNFHRQGIAKQLFTMALEFCKKNCPNISEFTVNSSPFAVDIYSKLGFQRTGTEEIKNGIRFIPMRMDIIIEEECHKGNSIDKI